jgi:hypothetical protein
MGCEIWILPIYTRLVFIIGISFNCKHYPFKINEGKVTTWLTDSIITSCEMTISLVTLSTMHKLKTAC